MPLLGAPAGPVFRLFSSVESKVFQLGLTTSVPVWKGELDSVTALAKFQKTQSYYDAQVGATYVRKLEEGRSLGLTASFGSASDKPFKDSSVDTVGATAFYSWKEAPSSSWLLLLNYSNNRPVWNNIPLTGFVYSYMPSRNFRGSFGAPFASVMWRFAERWALNAFTVVPWVYRSNIGYDLSERLQLFAGFDLGQQTFLRFGRTDSKERVYFDEKRATVGLRTPPMAPVSAELEAGYAFGRRIFEAESYGDTKVNLVELEAGPVVRLNLTVALR